LLLPVELVSAFVGVGYGLAITVAGGLHG
jgi:hypothetical protein